MLQTICNAIGNEWFWQFEVDFILWLQRIGPEGGFLYYIMQFFTLFGEEMLLIAVGGVVYWGLDKKRGERIAAMLMTTALFNPLLKNIFCRKRPFGSVTEIKNLKQVDGYSFPSGHSSSSTSVIFGSAYVYRDKKQKWLTAIGIVIPVMVALSRNYLGAHFISDVVCGLALGAGIVILLDYLFKVVANKYFVYGAIAILGLAGMFYCTTDDYFTGYGLFVGFVCGILFEEKITKFENTKVWWQVLIRLAIGGGLFLGLNEVIKLPFNGLFFESKDVVREGMVWAEHIFRTVRYAIVCFVCIGVYPLLFKYFDKLNNLGKKKDQQNEQSDTANTASETQQPAETEN